MTKEEKKEMIRQAFIAMKGLSITISKIRIIEELVDTVAKEISIGFMKWYGVKMIGFIIYLKEVKPNVTSNEIEEKMKEFEGKTYEEQFNIYLKEKEQ